MKKAQISSQIFTYILATVVIGLVVLVGYKAIGTVIETVSRANINEFRGEFIGKVSEVSKQFNAVKKYEFSLPESFDVICIIDSLDKTTKEFSSSVKGNSELGKYPFVKIKVDADTDKNVYLLKNKKIIEEFYVESLDVEKDVLCFENAGLNTVWLKGQGKTALLYQKPQVN